MRWNHALPLWATAVSAVMNLKQAKPHLVERQFSPLEYVDNKPIYGVTERQAASKFLTPQTQPFVVNGTGLPEVDFDVGESYAGLLPIGDSNPGSNLYFWFFPSDNPAADNEIMIWVTGGPGCSSVGELLQENGPFLWQPGVFKPIENKWSWNKLTNVVWVDQPVGAGFSNGNVTAQDENDLAQQFMGFWKNFISTFAMQGYKVYVTGSSYSGMYVPYISNAMLEANDTENFNVVGMQIFDGTFSAESVAEDISVGSFVEKWVDVFAFNDSFSQQIQQTAQKCGYTDYLEKYLVFPPAGVQPTTDNLPGKQDIDPGNDGCDLWDQVYLGINEQNPCFSPYNIFKRCPYVLDPLGFAEGSGYVPAGFGPVYFDRDDVKKAINAPNQTWEFCSTTPVFVNGTDLSLNGGPGSQPAIPNVIEKTQNVIIGHGSQDFVLIAEGTLLAIQNMTWGGKMGFQERPSGPLFVPYHDNSDFTTLAGAGVVGTVHNERGLTFFQVAQTGHFLSMEAPALSFRSLEVLLGRVQNLSSTVPFTTDTNATAQPPAKDFGNGTVLVGFVETPNNNPQAVLREASSAGSMNMKRWSIAVGAAITAAILTMA